MAGEHHRYASRWFSHRYSDQCASAGLQHFQCGGSRLRPVDGGWQLERRQLFQSSRIQRTGHYTSITGAQIQEFGNSARRVARGPGSTNADVSIFKNTNITERSMLQLRAEFFNFTNTPTFFLPAANSPTLTCIGNPGSACNS